MSTNLYSWAKPRHWMQIHLHPVWRCFVYRGRPVQCRPPRIRCPLVTALMPVRRLKVPHRKRLIKCYYGDPPVQMSGCGQILSSSSSSSHSPSLPLTGSPESTSRQARNRRWTDTRPETSTLEREEDAGIHGEQEVHSDHSLTITEKERERSCFNEQSEKWLDFGWSDLRVIYGRSRMNTVIQL